MEVVNQQIFGPIETHLWGGIDQNARPTLDTDWKPGPKRPKTRLPPVKNSWKWTNANGQTNRRVWVACGQESCNPLINMGVEAI